jgi:2-keto-4-pentenoate hydratase/2-oxohepta-3-ene-1,7-dioic acid hydratase in catechol pathway
MTSNGQAPHQSSKRNYAAFSVNGEQGTRIGHYNLERQEITALTFKSGTPLSNLYEVIEVGEAGVEATDEVLKASEVKLLAPISGRDVLAVGKNYVDHAKEFNSSG